MRKSNPGLTQHTRALAGTPLGSHYVVKDWATGQEHGFETEAEAHTARMVWAEAAKSAYRYTIYKVPGRF